MKNKIRILLILGFTHLNISAYAQKSALQWATYFGGSSKFTSASGTAANGVAIDKSGNVYITGWTYSLSGIATNGAYQTVGDSINGDAFLAKFSPSGSLLWATYYGGSGEETGIDVVLDRVGNAYISGYTASTSGIATNGAYQTSYGGGNYDGYLAKFSPSGSLLWGTYFGGDKEDECNATSIDTFGNVYIAGYTASSSGIATSGAYQTFKSGSTVAANAFIAKFTSTGNKVWATYFGGNKGNDAWGIATDISGNIYMTGNTISTSGIATSGAFKTIGDSQHTKIYLAKFNTNDSLLWATYYGGNNDDYESSVRTDIFGNVFISGQTTSSAGIATVGAYQTSYGGDNDLFLAKFNDSGKILWSTYYGGLGFDYGGVGVTDTLGNVYIGGYTSSYSGIATKGAYQTSNTDGEDVFLAKLSPGGGLLYGTYYGGNGSDYGGSFLAIDTSGSIFFTGLTYSILGIATSGAYQTSGNATDGDGFLAKFKIQTFKDDAGINSFISPAGILCSGSVPVKVQLKNYGIDTLKSVKIGLKINSQVQASYSWTGNLMMDSSITVILGNYNLISGTDTITAWTFNPNGNIDSIPGNDTAQIIDTVNALPKAFTGNNKSICLYNSIKIGGLAVSGDTYSWVSKPAGYKNIGANPIVNPIVTTTYYLTEKDTSIGCSNQDSVIITVNPLPDGSFTHKTLKDSVKFIPDSMMYLTYSWSFGDSGTSNQISPLHIYKKNGVYAVSLLVTDKNGCTSSYRTEDTINYNGIFLENWETQDIKTAPNPFTNKTIITYSIKSNAVVNATVYDITGRSIMVLCNGIQAEGSHRMEFDASNYNSGIYIVKMQINNEVSIQKIIKTN